MPAPVTLERFVGPALYVHGQGDVIVHEGTFAAGMIIPCHVHAEPVISLMLEGDGVEEVGGRTRLVTAQDLLLTPAYALHGYRFGRSGRWFNMQLTDAWLARVADGAAPLPDVAQIIHSHADAAGRRPRWLRGVEEAIDAAGAVTPSVDQLARVAGVHPTHLLRTFRRHHGMTISNYVRRRRIERARVEVAKGDRPLSAIALDAGFTDQSHFTRVFRQTFSETPGQYARSLRAR